MIEVEIWSDFLCPFCYIGRQTFEAALANFDRKSDVKVTYRSFELDPSAPKSQQISIHEYLSRKYGRSIEWAKEQNARVAEMANSVGLDFHIDQAVPTNSFDAHRLSHLALREGVQKQVLTKLFEAYFAQGKDLADHAVLKSIADSCGIPAEATEKMLKSNEFVTEVRSDESRAQELGISGVPFFVFNGEFGVSGAQPQEHFEQALGEALPKT